MLRASCLALISVALIFHQCLQRLHLEPMLQKYAVACLCHTSACKHVKTCVLNNESTNTKLLIKVDPTNTY